MLGEARFGAGGDIRFSCRIDDTEDTRTQGISSAELPCGSAVDISSSTVDLITRFLRVTERTGALVYTTQKASSRGRSIFFPSVSSV